MRVVGPSFLVAVWLALLSSSSTAQAFVDEPTPDRAGRNTPAAALPTVLSVLTGSVLTSEGRPAVGALVVSSAGGKTITGADGSFWLEVEVPLEATSVRVIAVMGSGKTGAAGSVRAALHPGGTSSVGAVQLASGTDCEPGWLPTFGERPGMDGGVYALAVFDDGSGGGPALYAAGVFLLAGAEPARRVAKWDGTSWSPVGGGVSSPGGSVFVLEVFDDGGGPALYAGGDFTVMGGVAAARIAKWDGTSWSPLGSGVGIAGNPTVSALAVFDDGSGGGPALYVGGEFERAGGLTVNDIAKWNGASWSPLGTGMSGFVYDLTVFDDGNGGGPALFAGGFFTSAGGVAANRIARWDGASWSALGSGLSGSPDPFFYYPGVYALKVFDDGSGGGPALHVGGLFTNAGGAAANYIAKWDGTSWSPLGSGTSGPIPFVTNLEVFNDGSGGGPGLYASGNFQSVGGVAANHVAKWNGTSWSPLGSGLELPPVMTVFDDGSGGGPALFAAGSFHSAGGVAATNQIAKWDGASWSPLAAGTGLEADVRALAAFDDGVGGRPALYAGGDFTIAGDVFANHVARWDGASWSSLGSGPATGSGSVSALAVFDDGSGPALYSGGSFTSPSSSLPSRIARWDGATWSSLGSGVSSSVLALTVFDDGHGPALYAGGSFTGAGGGAANRVARWNGTSWSPLGSGLNNTVLALAVFDDGSGPALYAGGQFTSAGGVPASSIARWNGASWSSLGSGLGGTTPWVQALAAFDDGSGPALYVGGQFTSAGGVAASRNARWDGASWSPVGTWGYGNVFALLVFDDGSGGGPALHAGGGSAVLGFGVKRWNGASWSPVGSGTNAPVLALGAHDDRSGRGPALVAGGSFTRAIDSGDSYIALWRGCDTFAPTLSCPEGVVALDGLGGAPGEIVDFTVTASDGSDPAPAVVCVPPSGSFFPRGTTLVACTATDAAGNQATCEFPVTVEIKARRR